MSSSTLIPYLPAILTAAIALIAAYLTYLQHKTNALRRNYRGINSIDYFASSMPPHAFWRSVRRAAKTAEAFARLQATAGPPRAGPLGLCCLRQRVMLG